MSVATTALAPGDRVTLTEAAIAAGLHVGGCSRRPRPGTVTGVLASGLVYVHQDGEAEAYLWHGSNWRLV